MSPAASLALLFLLIVVVVLFIAVVEARRQSARAREALGRSRSDRHADVQRWKRERAILGIRLAAAQRDTARAEAERDDYRRALVEPVDYWPTDVEPRVVHPSLRVVES